MTVTRRELLTAASAIGLAAGLSRETESAFQAPINPTWDVIPSTEAALLRRAAELVGFSGSDHFRSFDQSDYEEFFRVFETNHHATVNGGYLGVPSVDNLKMVYSIRLRRDQTADNEGDPAGVDFVLHAFGGQYRTPEVSTTELYTQIRGWLNNLGQTGEKRTKVYYRHLQTNSFGGEILRYILREKPSGQFSLADDGDGYWILTIAR